LIINLNKKRELRYFLLPLLSCIFLIIFTACGGEGDSGSPAPPLQELAVTEVTPAASAADVGTNTQIQATFNVDADPASISTSTFTLASSSGINVNGTVSYDTATKTATFSPAYSLAPLTSYTATISGVRDTAGNTMNGSYSWSFVTVTGFWAYDSDTSLNPHYFVSAHLVGEGTHCLIYLEAGQQVDPDTINSIVNQFDNAIYASEVMVFGEEPNPGIDGNSKIYIFLHDIRDSYTPSSGSYIAGYFSPLDEYDISISTYSNQKELLNMDIYPGIAGDPVFLNTLAHEFQHMINWNQKTNLRSVFEDTWLNEAMSEIAPVFCTYGPDYERVIQYQNRPWDSLVDWYGQLYDYAIVYMWAQYLKDRVTNTDSYGHNVFWNINHTADVGIDAVNTALAAVGYGKDFAGIFRDWSLANYLGFTTIPGHPEWSYASIHTEEGYPTIYGPLPGLPLNDAYHVNVTTVGGLHMWGLDYFEFIKSGTGTVTWTKTLPTDEAAFIDTSTNTVTFNMASGTPYTYINKGILITRNPTDIEKWTATGGGTMTFSSVREEDTLLDSSLTKRAYAYQPPTALLTPKALLSQIASDPVVKSLSAKTGRPIPVCVDYFFRNSEKALREKLSHNK